MAGVNNITLTIIIVCSIPQSSYKHKSGQIVITSTIKGNWIVKYDSNWYWWEECDSLYEKTQVCPLPPFLNYYVVFFQIQLRQMDCAARIRQQGFNFAISGSWARRFPSACLHSFSVVAFTGQHVYKVFLITLLHNPHNHLNILNSYSNKWQSCYSQNKQE